MSYFNLLNSTNVWCVCVLSWWRVFTAHNGSWGRVMFSQAFFSHYVDRGFQCHFLSGPMLLLGYDVTSFCGRVSAFRRGSSSRRGSWSGKVEKLKVAFWKSGLLVLVFSLKVVSCYGLVSPNTGIYRWSPKLLVRILLECILVTK